MSSLKAWYNPFTWGEEETPPEINQDEFADESMVDGFKRKARAWAENVKRLYYSRPIDPELQRERIRLLKWSRYIKVGIESIFGELEALNTVDFDNVDQLGILPLIPIAAIAASLALMSKWTFDYLKFNEKMNAIENLTNSGLSPKEAADIVAKTTRGASLFNIDSKMLLLGGGLIGAAIYFGRK